MSDLVPSLAAFPADLQATYPQAELVWGMLEASLTGLALYSPLCDEQGRLVDFRIDLLNPTAQRILQQPARPTGTYLQYYPHTLATGVFAFHRDAFESSAPARMNVNYQADGLDNYFQLSARRVGQGLLVSFTDTADAARTEVELALRVSQAQERAARAEVELQRQQLYNILEQAPAMICLFEGPQHTFQFVNPPYQALVGNRPLVGKPIAEAMPELAGQPIFDLLDQVYRTGETFFANEMLVQLDHANDGIRELEKRYYNFIYQARHNLAGAIDGIFVFAYDVTTLVLARLEVQHLNEELAALNEELHVSNEEYLTANTALHEAQHELQQLNQKLEGRVTERTAQLSAARAETEQQRTRLARLFMQAPAAICILDGPDLIFELINPIYQQFIPKRQLLGKPLLEALPELADHAAYHTMRHVFDTGEALWQQALHMPLARTDGGVLEDRYFNYVQQPRYDEQGRIDGVLVFGFEVTELVQARQQAEALQAQVLSVAQRQVQERETLYQVFAQTPAAICIQRGPEHRYDYLNQAYQDFFPGRHLLGIPVAEALPETVASGVVALLDHVYQTGETYYGNELPLQIAQPDGSLRQMYFTFTYQAYRENGEIVGISTFAYDVKEQVVARQEREVERQLLLSLFQEAPAGICILAGPELAFEFVNPGYQQLLPGRALQDRPVFEAMPELVGTPVETLLRQVYATGQPHEAQGLHVPVARPTDGVLEDRYFTFVYQGRRDAQGHIDGILVFVFEVTEQVQARQAAEASSRQLRLITDALPVLIGYIDREEKYRFANRAYEPWFHLRAEELLGRPIREVAGPQAYPTIQPYIARALAGEPVEFEVEMPFRPGFTKHIHTIYIPDVQHGVVQGFYTLVTDVTEQVEARRQVQDLNQELAAINEKLTATNRDLHESNTLLIRTNEDLDNFIYTASHDLKAPISNIEGLLYLLRDELPADVVQQGNVAPALHLMLEAVERFKRTIEHLTDVSKLQKEHTSATQAVQLATIVEGVQQDLAPLIQETGARLLVNVSDFPPVSFSEKNLRSVVYNLLSNALKYRSPDRSLHVDVRAHVRAGYTVLEVHDNGLGIEPHQLPKLYTMFQRFHTHIEGTGIGLFMVKRMVENAGGRLEVHSQPGAGTTFFVYLPHMPQPSA
ncbi:PAS domain-containing protein [Hymenobacter volaticus]|uniref:histidine kinase n=1 Tax=Hymenobacter volaticus TaxID=2932254 RepID=A0ABY4GFI1_9BACT|nr:PAS domain-containing protein [Hymenobacter volaticus]UOQ69718.1 PAS domain-containing protein [Hymenobacter volaticus]